MKNLFTILLLLFITTFVFPQAGSIKLSDGGGTLVSTHTSTAEAYNIRYLHQ